MRPLGERRSVELPCDALGGQTRCEKCILLLFAFSRIARRRASGGKWRSPQKASARPMASAAFGTNARARGAPAAHGRSCEAAPCLFLSDPSASTSTPSTSTPREFCLASLLMIREMMLTSLMVLGFLRTDEVSAHSLRNRSTPCLHI